MHPQSNTPPLFGDIRLPARFWAKVRVGSIPAHRPDLGSCWEWTACRNVSGYGNFRIGSHRDDSARTILAHRWAYETLIGPIPAGLEPDHLCRNPACVYPAHIEPVTHSVNLFRSPLVGRNGGARGEANVNAKLAAVDIPAIRALRGKVPGVELAWRYGVSPTHISHIQLGKAWRHV